MAVYLLSRYASPFAEREASAFMVTKHPPHSTSPHHLNLNLHLQIRANHFRENRIGDPLFALTMGVTAAFTRIRRDQVEKNPERALEIGYGTVIQLGQRRLQRWWNGDFQDL